MFPFNSISAKNGDKGYGFHCGLGQDKKMEVGCHSHVVDADESNDQRNPFNLVTGDKMEICVCESANLCNSSAIPTQARFKSQVCKSNNPGKLYLLKVS